jgi:hypothetical protein
MKIKYLLISLVLITACSKDVEKTPNSPNPVSPTMPLEIILNGPLASGGDVEEKFQHTPDGTKVVYIADESTNGDSELYVSDSDGTNKRKLQGVPSGRDVKYFIISPDSLRVAFLMDINTSGMYDLFTINIDGTGLTQLNQGLNNAAHTVSRTFKFTPDSSKVVFVTNEITGVRNLFIANPVSPVNRTQLNTSGKAPVSSVFEIAQNGSRVVYKESSDPAHPNIRSVQPSSTGDIQLNPNFTLPASGASDFSISPTSSKVVYRANQDNDAIYELYAVNLDGTGSVNKINGSIVSGGSVQPIQFKITSNGSKVVYIADQQTDEIFELYVSNIDGSNNLKINGALENSTIGINKTETSVIDFKLTDDNLKAIFRTQTIIKDISPLPLLPPITVSDIKYLNSASITGTAQTLIAQKVGEYQTKLNRVVYASDFESSGIYSIYNGTTKLNPPITTGVGFFDPAQASATLGTRQIGFSFDGSRVVMVGSYQGTQFDIFSVALDGTNFKKVNTQSGGSIVLNSTSDGSGFLTLPTKQYAVYRYNDGSKTQLYVGLIKE